MLSGEKCNYFQSRVLKLLSLTSCYREQVSVQRGIYERFNGVYEQPMTEIIQHLERIGNQAKLQFAGHSLGGSLSLLDCLMLLTRKVVKPSALPPVVTFGSPLLFFGGQKVLDQLGLDENHVHCVVSLQLSKASGTSPQVLE